MTAETERNLAQSRL